MAEDIREDFRVVIPATLMLLGLIIGFNFSMAANRYDQRKNYEEAEANTIGTEYVRADLLSFRLGQSAGLAGTNAYCSMKLAMNKTSGESTSEQRNCKANSGQLFDKMLGTSPRILLDWRFPV